jgi:hypothetical protein
MTTWYAGAPIPDKAATWTDNIITAGTTTVKKRHLIELREMLETMHGHFHLFSDEASGTESPAGSVSWSDPSASIVADSTRVRAPHWNELRANLTAMNYHTHTSHGQTSTSISYNVAWATPITADTTYPKKSHIDELRAACVILSGHTHTACCNAECGCNGTCGCQGYCYEDCCSQCWWFD